jgi:hypothetical protein
MVKPATTTKKKAGAKRVTPAGHSKKESAKKKVVRHVKAKG